MNLRIESKLINDRITASELLSGIVFRPLYFGGLLGRNVLPQVLICLSVTRLRVTAAHGKVIPAYLIAGLIPARDFCWFRDLFRQTL